MKAQKIVLAVAVFITALTNLHAEGTEVKYNEFLKSVTIKGDLRLRHESFFNKTVNTTDRHRERFRLRIGADFGLPADVTVKTRFATGGSDQVSQNQSYSELGSKKEFRVDQAFVQWKANDSLTLLTGKMANPLWRLYSSDIVWDDDFNPEGFAQQFKFRLPGLSNTRGFANFMQSALAEQASDNSNDKWLFAQQVGLDTLVFDQSRITISGALYEWVNERSNVTTTTTTFNQTTNNTGNRRVGNAAAGALLNEFRVWELTGEYATYVGEIPLSLQGTYIVNVRSQLTPKEDTGLQVGAILGKANAANTWEFAWFFKQSRTDATVADVADSDFGNGGTNRRGHILWIGYSPTDYLNLKGKYFMTRTLNTSLSPNFSDINRFQLDLSVKF